MVSDHQGPRQKTDIRTIKQGQGFIGASFPDDNTA